MEQQFLKRDLWTNVMDDVHEHLWSSPQVIATEHLWFKPTLVQVMAWCHQVPEPMLNKIYLAKINGITKSHWVSKQASPHKMASEISCDFQSTSLG